MTTIYSTKQQRSEEKSKGILGWLIPVFFIVLIGIFLTGCATTLDKTVSACLAQERDVEFTQAEGFTKASCSGPSRSTTTVKVAR